MGEEKQTDAESDRQAEVNTGRQGEGREERAAKRKAKRDKDYVEA